MKYVGTFVVVVVVAGAQLNVCNLLTLLKDMELLKVWPIMPARS